MKQSFTLKIATDDLVNNAVEHHLSIEQLQQIQIKVSIALIKETVTINSSTHLELDYEIHLPSQALFETFHWPMWQADNVRFTDYLWEQTCLECFFTTQTKSYIEINASPGGQYALYQFEDYRTPSTLPPLPLLREHNGQRAAIHWHNPQIFQNQVLVEALTYRRRFSVPLDKLPDDSYNADSNALDHVLIHPCVILYVDSTPFYFAPDHPSPADFHDRQYWSRLLLT